MKTLHEKGIHQPGVLDLRPLMELVRVLREPGGCPWDRVQTHTSMRRELVEEVYEMLEAIDDGNVAGMREEMGDVLLQVVFHARLAEEEGLFAMQDVIDDVVKKLVHRHPHVFGDTKVTGAEEVMANWETLKAQEKTERTHALDGIAKGLPALMRAYKLSAKAAKTGFDWPDAPAAWQKVEEEKDELQEAAASRDRDRTEEELGDLLFALAVYARKLDLEPETTLNRANNKFQRRFEQLEAQVKQEGKEWKDLTLEELEHRWQEAKRAVGDGQRSADQHGGTGRES